MTEKKDSEKKDLVKQDEEVSTLPSDESLRLAKGSEVDLSGLTEEQKQELKMKYAGGMIDVTHKAAEAVVDTQTLDSKLDTMAEHTKEVGESGSSVTITATQEDSIGRTEIIMGDSEAAKKGRLSRSQTGQRDLTLVWIGLGIFVIVVIAIIALMR